MLLSDAASSARYLFAGFPSSVIRVWDRESFERVGTLKGHTGSVGCLLVIEEGFRRWLISSGSTCLPIRAPCTGRSVLITPASLSRRLDYSSLVTRDTSAHLRRSARHLGPDPLASLVPAAVAAVLWLAINIYPSRLPSQASVDGIAWADNDDHSVDPPAREPSFSIHSHLSSSAHSRASPVAFLRSPSAVWYFDTDGRSSRLLPVASPRESWTRGSDALWRDGAFGPSSLGLRLRARVGGGSKARGQHVAREWQRRGRCQSLGSSAA